MHPLFLFIFILSKIRICSSVHPLLFSPPFLFLGPEKYPTPNLKLNPNSSSIHCIFPPKTRSFFSFPFLNSLILLFAYVINAFFNKAQLSWSIRLVQRSFYRSHTQTPAHLHTHSQRNANAESFLEITRLLLSCRASLIVCFCIVVCHREKQCGEKTILRELEWTELNWIQKERKKKPSERVNRQIKLKSIKSQTSNPVTKQNLFTHSSPIYKSQPLNLSSLITIFILLLFVCHYLLNHEKLHCTNVLYITVLLAKAHVCAHMLEKKLNKRYQNETTCNIR